MQSKYKILFIVLSIIITAFVSNCNANPTSRQTFHSKKPSNNVTSDTNSNYSLILCPIESIPIINLQVHKTVNRVQAIFCTPHNLSVCLKCYNFFSGSGHSWSILSQKTLLFPFHTFW